MARKTDEVRLKEIEDKMQQLKSQKQRLANKLSAKERKQRTKRLIEIGAIFEKYFEIEDQEEAEKIAMYLAGRVKAEKGKFKDTDIEKLRQLHNASR